MVALRYTGTAPTDPKPAGADPKAVPLNPDTRLVCGRAAEHECGMTEGGRDRSRRLTPTRPAPDRL